MKNADQIHARINVRAKLLEAQTANDAISYGGKGNATMQNRYYHRNTMYFINKLILNF